jgi:hypothetical protein
LNVLSCCACCATKSRQVTCNRNCLLLVNLPKAVPKLTSCFRGIPAASFACAADGAEAALYTPAPHALLHAVVRERIQGV